MEYAENALYLHSYLALSERRLVGMGLTVDSEWQLFTKIVF